MAQDQRQPNNWEDDSARIRAKDAFIAELVANEEERNKCRESREYAKRKFADIGGFHIEGAAPTAGLLPLNPNSDIRPIPAATEFRVYRNGKIDRPERDKQVIFVLPPVGTELPENLKEVREWRCTYSPYALDLEPPK